MDDLDAVLASLELTETALSAQPAHAQSLEAQPITIKTDLQTDFAAELDAELNVVFAQPQSGSLLPGGPVHYLGVAYEDFTRDGNKKIELIRKFILEIQTCVIHVNTGDREDDVKIKQSMKEISDKYHNLYNEVETLFKRFEKLTIAEKGYWNVKSVKEDLRTIRKEMNKEYTNLEQKFYARFPQAPGNQNEAGQNTDTTQQAQQAEDISDIQPAEIQTLQKLTDNFKHVTSALNNVRDAIEDMKKYEKEIDNFINEGSKETDKSSKANQMHDKIRTKQDALSSLLIDAYSKVLDLQNFTKKNKMTNENKTDLQKIEEIYNKLSKSEKDIRFDMTLQSFKLEKICTPEYVKSYKEKQTQKYGNWDDLQKGHELANSHKKKTREHSTSHVFHTNTPAPPHHASSFAAELTRFTQTLLVLVYPPTAAPPWTSPPANAGASRPQAPSPQPKKTPIPHPPNTHVAALCARLAHITAVAALHPAVAALRFSVEFAQGAALFDAALAPPQTVAGARLPEQPHKNIVDIRKHVKDTSFKRLHNLASMYSKPNMHKQQYHTGHNRYAEIDKHYKKEGFVKGQEIHQRSHEHKEHHKKNPDKKEVSEKKVQSKKQSWSWLTPIFLKRADDAVESFKDDVSGTHV